MALETTKSLGFDLNLTGNDHRHRYNTIGSQRQVSHRIRRDCYSSWLSSYICVKVVSP
jgi:hypothetical protein